MYGFLITVHVFRKSNQWGSFLPVFGLEIGLEKWIRINKVGEKGMRKKFQKGRGGGGRRYAPNVRSRNEHDNICLKTLAHEEEDLKEEMGNSVG